jgi:hypothetical protein
MRRIGIVLVVAFALASAADIAGKEKKQKPWTDWTKKEAEKMLNYSPWGQTQVETNTSDMVYNPATSRRSPGLDQAASVNFRIRFLSAKPIRQAFARAIELTQTTPNKQLSEQLRGFVERKSDQWIVIAVTYDSTDQRLSGDAMQSFRNTNAGMIKNNTYLETKDGKRVFLQEYAPPDPRDGLGAKFVFPRTVDGRPFVTTESIEVRFYSEFTQGLTLNMRFKLADMIYEGALEY